VSFGASIWGMTDFAASLNRTIVIPFVILLAWFFFRWFHSPWRYAIFPALTLLSLLHLSALHVVLVFLAFEGLDFAIRRRFRPTRDLATSPSRARCPSACRRS
jgi:TRAP-type C4-dicarboxylate transport system permease small subunit